MNTLSESLLIEDLNDISIVNSYIPGGVLIVKTDPYFTILEANKGYFDLIGYTKEEIYTKYHNKGILTIHPEDRAIAIEYFHVQTKSCRDQKFNLKTRLVNKNSDYIWVNFSGRVVENKNGFLLVYILLVDITEHMAILEQLEKEQSFNALTASLTGDAFFECDIKTSTMRYSKNFANRIGVDEFIYDYPKPLLDKGIIAEESLHLFENRYNEGTDGIVEEEVHFKLNNGTDVWYSNHYIVLTNSDGVAVRAVGKLTDITKHKIKIDELSERAEKDQLTDLYNKVTTEHLIKKTLKKSRSHIDKHALIIIDVDNFKNINDKLGHLFGDIVLAQLADTLKPLFRSYDIIGRIGGDEFFVFIKNYKSIEVLHEKAKEICRLFTKLYSENNVSVEVSSSIGISLYPEHGTNFDELYKSADEALYMVKAKGKKGYLIFDGNSILEYKSKRTEIDVKGYIQKSFKDNRIEYVFKLLYDSENPESSIHSVLKLITEHFGFSRGYIFENSKDGIFSSNTFEWCAEGIKSEIDNLQNVPLDQMPTTTRELLESGMHIISKLDELTQEERAILEPQDIKSMLVFAVQDKGKFIGFVGFDNCVKEHTPTPEDIDEIRTICHVLGTFLIKLRANEYGQKYNMALSTIVDNIRNSIYVVDIDSYTVLFENKYALKITGKSIIGRCCYTEYYNKTRPCRGCPITNISEDNPECEAKLTNHKLGTSIMAVATMVEWDGNKRACLISCTNISD